MEAILANIDRLTGGAPVAGVILGLILVISIAGLTIAPQLIQRNLLRPFNLARRRDLHTWITSGFIHADFGHLLFNSITLWSFGFALERAIGSPRMFWLYLIGLVASGLGSYFKHRDDPLYASLGASGAILAVLFASIIYFPTRSIYLMILPIPIPAPLFAVGYLAWTIWAAKHGRGRINHDAHLGGAIAGVLFVAFTDGGALQRALQTVFG
jgi:membrane associated rhomboid family serine protease